ncbi:MAG: chemotaxis protein CheX [Desulfuromonadaceae bacterium]|nr:chemotaxis protein CheX [Desulfuromonadaceae bacterium]
MSEKLEQDVCRAIATTLENMAFMEVSQEVEGAKRYPAEEMAVTRLLVHDPVQGELYLLMPKPLLAKIVSSVYIMPEEELSEQMLLDMLGELINTVAGLFLNAYLPEDQTYSLGLPEQVLVGQEDSPFELKRWDFQIDNHMFSLALAGDGFFIAEQS